MAEDMEDKTNKDTEKSWRWRVFSIGGALGLGWGTIYLFLPVISSALTGKSIQIFPIPFSDFTETTGAYLPAVATGLSWDLGNLITGMVMPFFGMVGSFIGLLITVVLNPILYRHGVMRSWEPGQTTVQTIFSNNIDFYFSFQIGISLAIAFFGIWVAFSTMARSQRNKKFAADLKAQRAEIEDISRRRGHVPMPFVLLTYIFSTSCYIILCGFLIHWDWRVMMVLFFFADLYTPLISYVTARLEGLAGQVIEIPFITEIAFILSGYTGAKIWFLPIPKANYGVQVVSYKQAELLGCKFGSVWKAQLLLFPIIILSSLFFSSFIWSLAEIPSAVYPYTEKIWDLTAKNTCLVYSATLGEYSQFSEALGWAASSRASARRAR